MLCNCFLCYGRDLHLYKTYSNKEVLTSTLRLSKSSFFLSEISYHYKSSHEAVIMISKFARVYYKSLIVNRLLDKSIWFSFSWQPIFSPCSPTILLNSRAIMVQLLSYAYILITLDYVGVPRDIFIIYLPLLCSISACPFNSVMGLDVDLRYALCVTCNLSKNQYHAQRTCCASFVNQ